MKIAIDIRSTLKRKTGIGYYTLNLINSLAAVDTKNEYFLYSKVRPFSRKKKLPALPAANFRHKIDRLGIGPPRVLSGVDIFHASSFDIEPPNGAKFILTVHDIIPRLFPQWHSQDTIRRLENDLPRALSRADAVLVDARSTAEDLKRYYFALCKDKLRVVYPGASEGFSVLGKAPKGLYESIMLPYGIDSEYIVYVGTLEPRKNIEGLIKAFAMLRQKYHIRQQLVIVGMKGWGFDAIFRLVEKLGLSREVVFTGYVTQEGLKVFYNLADLCVYPSFYEGAGLPVLEAFKCGCPVVASNASCIPEFASGAAELVDPKDVNSIADGMYKLLSDEKLRARLREKGLKRAAEFTWQRTAQQVLEVFEGLVER